ncbi:uncharacterized protein [Amphiura filiformis]|uniref:uncharacterized protein n=1 Tax=Amphiura filiformis TaxID=82378 RepID=UPI003B22776C
MFTCESGECIQRLFVCDGTRDCEDNTDELNCRDISSACAQGWFQCPVGGCIQISYLCDFIPHCVDASDENDCVFPNCTASQFRCANGECIDESLECNLITDCVDGSDEDQCRYSLDGFQCYDGSWIPRSAYCDQHRDCTGKIWEDEPNECSTSVFNSTDLQCKNGAYVKGNNRCTYQFNALGYPVGCRDATHLENCGDFNCSEDTLKCPGSYCIDIQYRCDDVMDCPNGEDEVGCEEYTCPGYYRCQGQSYCLSIAKTCDGIKQCPRGDDELFCGYECPEGCNCVGYSYKCVGIPWTPNMAKSIPRTARAIIISHVRHTSNRVRRTPMIEPNQTIYDTIFIHPSDYELVAYLELAYCGIEYIERNTFSLTRNLLQLILVGNKISILEAHVFHGLQRLHYLDVSNNPLTEVMPGAFKGLKLVSILDIRQTQLDTFDYSIFVETPKIDFL